MLLLIDDMKNGFGEDVIARTYKAGMHLLLAHTWRGVLLDHDLGEERTGYDLARSALYAAVLPPWVRLVTHNPVGRERLHNLLLDNGYTCSGDFTYMRKP